MSSVFAARVYACLTGVVVIFQLALAAGMPWGSLAMGGAYPGRMPPALRVAAVVQALVLLLFAVVVYARAGLVLLRWAPAARRLIWGVVGFMMIGAVLNALTPSFLERAVWLPVTLGLLFCALTTARNPSPTRE